VSYVSAAAEAAPSYTSYCLAAKQSGATAVMTALASPAVISIAQDCVQQGYSPHFLLAGAPVGPTFEATAGLNGSLAVEGVFPWIADNTPATEAFHNAVKKYESSITKTDTWNATTAYSWAGAELFGAAAAKMKGDSPAALATALYSLKNVTLGGLIPPESFSASKQTNPDCYTQIKQENGKYQLVNGGKFACPPATAS
jgi:branched-chain amino acid transport system substrate-binding protein